MRKSILALTAAGGVFALTAAAASTLSVSGPFNPRTGADDTRECDLGALSYTTQDDGTNITGVTLTGASDLADGNQCDGKKVWVRLTFSQMVEEEGDWSPVTTYAYGKATIDDDLHGGQIWSLNTAGASGLYTTIAATTAAADANKAPLYAIQISQFTNAQVLVTEDSSDPSVTADWATVDNAGALSA